MGLRTFSRHRRPALGSAGSASRRHRAVHRLPLLLVAQFRHATRDIPGGGRLRRALCRYGGEDTDFGKSLDLQDIRIAWLRGALAYHQYHPHHMPPVHHLDSVVRNAQLFEAKWGYRTMGHWLHAFRLMGLIDDEPGRPIRILRRPSQEDLALTGQQSHQP